MMSCCSEHHEEHRVGGKRFTCPMHPEVRSDTPGRCPKCGMDLVKEESEGEGEEELKKPHDHEHHDHAAHDHHAMMSGPGAARDFLRRFAIVTVLLIPLLATSEPALRLLRIPDFSFRASLQFGIATAIFLFALVFFEHAKHEIKARKIGLMTLVSVAVAAATVLVWSLVMGQSLVFAVTLAITVLVIACPHALGLAIPTVSTIATQLAVKNGVFLKDLAKLEVVKDIDYVVFDKTGTLTEGKFGVTEIVVLGEKETQNGALTKKQKDLLTVAASLEAHSTHVIGLSILSFAKQQNRTPKAVEKFKNLAGKGIEGRGDRKTFAARNRLLMEERGALTKEARVIYDKLSQEGKTVVFLSEGKTVSGLIALSDRIKPESQTAVEALHRIGVKVAMLTGDSQEVAKDIAGQLSIDTYFAQVLPDKKYEHIKTLQDRGNKVMMVGDGVNDAPALKQADVGVAIGAGTDVAVEAGDIVLTRNNPQDILSIIVLSRKVFRKMVENLVWALGYNVFAIPAAAGLFIPLGFRLNPKIGAIAMSLSSVIVVAIAMTLRKAKLQV